LLQAGCQIGLSGSALVLLGIALTNRRTPSESAPGEPAQFDGSLVVEADQGM